MNGPPRSPNLTPLNYYLWGYMKTLEKHKTRVCDENLQKQPSYNQWATHRILDSVNLMERTFWTIYVIVNL